VAAGDADDGVLCADCSREVAASAERLAAP
jgi:hypothetical protein